MLRLKNILLAVVLAAAGFLFLDAALDAAVWEIDHSPRLTPEQIRAECAAHYTPACAGKGQPKAMPTHRRAWATPLPTAKNPSLKVEASI